MSLHEARAIYIYRYCLLSISGATSANRQVGRYFCVERECRSALATCNFPANLIAAGMEQASIPLLEDLGMEWTLATLSFVSLVVCSADVGGFFERDGG